MTRWAWCLDGRHADCRAQREAGDGMVDTCGCWCHRGEEQWGMDVSFYQFVREQTRL